MSDAFAIDGDRLLIDCDCCHGTGRLWEFRATRLEPYGGEHRTNIRCAACDATGIEELQAEPITEGDLPTDLPDLEFLP